MSARLRTCISTGIPAMDIDMEGGVRRPGESQAVVACLPWQPVLVLVKPSWASGLLPTWQFGGLTVGFISAELQTRRHLCSQGCSRCNQAGRSQTQKEPTGLEVGAIDSPDHHREDWCPDHGCSWCPASQWRQALVKDPWGASVDDVINTLRSMKAKNPDLRAAVIDHFHVPGSSQGCSQL